MKEADYVLASQLARVRIMTSMPGWLDPTETIPAKELREVTRPTGKPCGTGSLVGRTKL